jgi:hypothetical protein
MNAKFIHYPFRRHAGEPYILASSGTKKGPSCDEHWLAQ